jgi:uncharacterized membrane protein SpoIIM required for sporulation
VRVRGLGFDELREVGRLYRRCAARLARLRERGDDPETIRHLNALCVRAHGLLYASQREPEAARPRLGARLADAIARSWRVQVLAWVLLGAGAVLGAGLGLRDDDALYALVPADLGYSDGGLEALAHSPTARAAFFAHDRTSAAHNALFGSSLFARNTRVGLLSFATGILGGVPTVLLQTYNGLVLGAFASIFARDPLPVAFAAWILPHAIPELTAITLCAAAGLLLGFAIASPGRGGRRSALREAQDPALLLFGASIPLFALAAAVESFVRESALGDAARLAIAAGFALALAAALAAVRRLARRRHPDLRWLDELNAPVRGGLPDSGSAPAP